MAAYPIINFVVQQKQRLAMVAAALIFILFVAAALLYHAPLAGVLGLALAGVTWFLVALLGEVVQVIAETLLPR